MTTSISTKGQIVLPIAIRQRDKIEPGQLFEVRRVGRGQYLLKRVARKPGPRSARGSRKGLVAMLSACPVKGWFTPLDRAETTDDVSRFEPLR